ncbi:hypothetical protein GGH19_001972 [Coemansia sp. RSA 1807]|nr:hypothetical protein GGH19_001972 [Coemansia sp. RSA 1807]
MADTDLAHEWTQLQSQLLTQVIEHDDLSFSYDPHTNEFSGLHIVGGVDISYPRTNPDHAIVALSILSFPSLSLLHQTTFQVCINVPYIAGFLAFREIHAYKQAFASLQAERPDLMPQILLVDGNGTLHPRRFGSACHLGIELNMPTIGVAKSLLHFDDLSHVGAKELKGVFREGAREVELKGQSGSVYGRAVRPPGLASNPVFVSSGHRVSLDTAVRVVRACSKVRVPEPIRVADQQSRKIAQTIESIVP